jgi:hypothetical protein
MTITKPQEKMASMLLSDLGEPHCDWCDEDLNYGELVIIYFHFTTRIVGNNIVILTMLIMENILMT